MEAPQTQLGAREGATASEEGRTAVAHKQLAPASYLAQGRAEEREIKGRGIPHPAVKLRGCAGVEWRRRSSGATATRSSRVPMASAATVCGEGGDAGRREVKRGSAGA